MKKRTSKEAAAAMRAYRARKRAQTVTPVPLYVVPVTPSETVTPTAPACLECQRLASAIGTVAAAREQIASLEGQLAAARRTATVTPLHQFNNFGRNLSIGVASR